MNKDTVEERMLAYLEAMVASLSAELVSLKARRDAFQSALSGLRSIQQDVALNKQARGGTPI